MSWSKIIRTGRVVDCPANSAFIGIGATQRGNFEILPAEPCYYACTVRVKSLYLRVATMATIIDVKIALLKSM